MRVWLRPDRIARLGITVPDIVERDLAAEPAVAVGPDRRPAGRARHRVHLHGPDAGAPAERGGVRRDHRPLEPGRLAGPPEGRRAASSSAPSSTTPSAATTRKPAAVIAVFQIPGTNALAVADEIKKTMEDLQARFPRDMDYKVSLDTTLPVVGGHQRDRAHAVRGGRPRHHRRLHLPAELARDADPAADRAGLARRRVHLLPAARLLDQRALAARPRPRDRHRRRRRDCRRRGGHAPHRARHDAEGGHLQGDGGGVGAGRGHRADPGRGVRAGRLHGRHLGHALPAVRDHDRDLGAAVGVQRADAVAGAGGDAAEAADRQEDAADAVLPRASTRCSARAPNGYITVRGLPGRASWW